MGAGRERTEAKRGTGLFADLSERKKEMLDEFRRGGTGTMVVEKRWLPAAIHHRGIAGAMMEGAVLLARATDAGLVELVLIKPEGWLGLEEDGLRIADEVEKMAHDFEETGRAVLRTEYDSLPSLMGEETVRGLIFEQGAVIQVCQAEAGVIVLVSGERAEKGYMEAYIALKRMYEGEDGVIGEETYCWGDEGEIRAVQELVWERWRLLTVSQQRQLRERRVSVEFMMVHGH